MANHNPFKVTALAAAIAAAGAVTPAYALFDYEDGDFKVSLDTDISIGAGWRASDRNYRNVGDYNAAAAGEEGHLHGTSSQDGGDLLWKKGSTYTEVLKITADLELNYKNYGAFIRGKAFYDNRLVNGDGVTDKPMFYGQSSDGSPLEPHQSEGASADILDAFVWGDWWIGEMPLNARLGRQVISWGEGILFPNGINTINPVDVGALLTPGSEVKDALIPLNALYASLGITENLSIEGFVLFEWKRTELPACGTFFSTTDLAGSGCNGGFYSGGTETGSGTTTQPTTPFASESIRLPRGDDREPSNDGQFGLATRYFASAIETEFGLYFINYHSQAPLLSGHMPTTPGGLPLATYRSLIISNPANPLGPLGTSIVLPAADYLIEYPEDIQLFGASFNTTLDFGLPGGATSVSGEISMRKDQPFQLEDGDTIGGLIGLPAISCYDAPTPYDCYSKYDPGEYSPGYVLKDYFQAEVAFIHFFDQILGASRWTALLDIAGSYLDLPSKSQYLLNSSYNATLNVPGIRDNLISTGQLAGLFGSPQVPYDVFLDALYGALGTSSAYPEKDYYPTSGAWGYKMRFIGDYPNVFAGINLRPSISFSHDVSGTTPGPITNFLQNRKALGLALEADYLNTYSLKVGYTDFYGAEPYNQLADRDFYSLSLSASF